MIKKILTQLKHKNDTKVSESFVKLSYSQCGEDLIVSFIFKNIIQLDKPSFIDIGANHPFSLNNTFLFYSSGSRGINIDPNPVSIELFNKFRPADRNLEIGISDKKGTLQFYQNSNSALGTFSEEEARINGGTIGIVSIDVITIQELLMNYCNNIFPDFLSIDVEGYDQKILESIDYEGSLPKVICVETIRKIGTHQWRKNMDIIDLLTSNGYHHHSDTTINSIFVLKNEMKEIII